MADDVDRLAGEFALGALQHRFEIQGAPVRPGGLEALEGCRPRFADATVVVGHDIQAVGEQVVGEAKVVAAAHRGGGADDHHRALWIRLGMAPGKAAEHDAVGRGLLEAFAGATGRFDSGVAGGWLFGRG
ncbi:hypothetical protein P308_01850 [Pseudomonas piscis]|nr:hypothetical protein P308_01850 [Pseudomonas piscis]